VLQEKSADQETELKFFHELCCEKFTDLIVVQRSRIELKPTLSDGCHSRVPVSMMILGGDL
jgi:hypothetical protein